MTPADLFPASPEASAENALRLRTIVMLRWLAILGQTATLAVAHWGFGLRLPLAAAAAAIGILLVLNLFTAVLAAASRRLSEDEAMGSLLLDIFQLAALLALTGGINNPFALLILVPVTISATALAPRSAILLGVVAIGLVTAMTGVHLPLRDASGVVLHLPLIFQFGSWAAIVIGILFIGLFSHRVAAESRAMSRALLATQMALAREQKLTDLGGVVAAAAHELGTPLATITLVASELLDEVEGEAAEDVRLIRDQADRCRDILRSMGRAGKDDRYLRAAPVEAVLREAAEPHATRGKTLVFTFDKGPQPVILRRPELVHGLRNLIQNAVDFAADRVEIHAGWTGEELRIAMRDDGPGYPLAVLTRIGEPFVRQRPFGAPEEGARGARPGYEGMGLGLFIAKTLLERTGARLRFSNTSAGGAAVDLVWPRGRIEAGPQGPLGENDVIEV